MTRIVGIAGSLRKSSFNAALLRAAAAAMPAGATLEIASIAGIPLYDGDVESEGMPEPVERLKERIVAANGLLLVTPEYNHSIPGVLKNAIDWLSRPPRDIERVFGGRPVAVLGASAGRFGTILSQAAWLPVLKTLGMRIYSGKRVLVAQARDAFDEQGVLKDERVRKELGELLADFAAFAAGNAAR